MERKEIIGELKKYMYMNDLKMKDVAEELGYTHGSFNTILCMEEKFSDNAKEKICNYLGIEA